jgi:hypothetical protein
MTAGCVQAWYVYSVLPAAADAPAAQGILPDSGLEAIDFGQLTVLASRVPRSLFDSASPANRTADPAWMAARLEAHHAVNVAATEAGACLPLAFGVLFSDLELLRQWVTPRAAALRSALARVAGHAEWALSMQEDAAAHAAWLDREDPDLKRLSEAAAVAGEGTAYLLARRLDKERTAARLSHIGATAAAIAERLTAARFGLLDEPLRPGLPGWTLLISGHCHAAPARPDALSEQVRVLAADLEPAGLSLRLSGPWPAYGFARLALAQEEVDA